MKRKAKLILGRISVILVLVVLSLFINYYRSIFVNESPGTNKSNSNLVEVHYIDVGQGDAIFIEAGEESMLIDAGESNKGSVVVDYLKAHGLTNLDYIIGTHPHSDHIGGLEAVIDAFPIGKVIFPSVTHNTQTFEDLLDTLDRNNIKLTSAVAGDQYTLGPAMFTIFAPNASTYDELNSYSLVIKLTLKDNSFLFTGDATAESEREMLAKKYELTSDVIKIGHHGSAYSTTNKFLAAVDPTYAVISVGDNEYGHPHKNTLEAIYKRDIKLYRTDKQGTVVFTSDGKTISVNTQDYRVSDTN